MAIKRTIQRASAAIPMPWLRDLARPALVAPCYHLVHTEELAHVKHLFSSRTPELFASDLDFFCRYFTPISLAELQTVVTRHLPLPPRAALITFDDGFREGLELAAPILERKGIPAVFFVNPAFLDNRDLSYRCKASLLAERLIAGPPPSAASQRAVVTLLDAHHATPDSLASRLLALPYRHSTLLDKAAELLEVDFANYLDRQRPYLSRDHLRQLLDRGFAVGAHGIDHAPFAELAADERLRQVVTSSQMLRRLLELESIAFAFPFTDRGLDRQFFEHAREEGRIELFFGTGYLREDSIPWSFQRFPIDERERPARELMAWLLIKKIGRSIIRRDRIERH